MDAGVAAARPRRRWVALSALGVVVLAAAIVAAVVAVGGGAGGTAPVAKAVNAPAATGLHAKVAVSQTSLRPGQQLQVTWSWTDGDGALVDLNHLESSAVRYARPAACADASTHVPHPSSGHGTDTVTAPSPTGPFMVAGLSLPFDHPERIRVGIDVHTGGSCAPEEHAVAYQWVTVYPTND